MKKIFFSLIAFLIVFFVIEMGSRLYERQLPDKAVESKSPLAFQKLLEGHPVREAQLPGPGRYAITWAEVSGQWIWQKKPEDEYRILIFGGSQAASLGYPGTAAYSGVMEFLLNQNLPKRKYRVINLGRTGYSSVQNAYLAENAIPVLKPDLVIVLMGNNEYLDMASYMAVKSAPEPIFISRFLQRQFAFFRLIRPAFKENKEVELEVQPVPNMKKTEKMRRFVLQRFARSLNKISKAAQKGGAKLLFCSVAVNHQYRHDTDWWFLNQNADEFHEDFLWARWAMAYGAPKIAVERLLARQKEDPENPGIQYLLGKAYKLALQEESANEQFEKILSKFEQLPEKAFSEQDGIQIYFARLYLLAAALIERKDQETAKNIADRMVTFLKGDTEDESRYWKIGVLDLLIGEDLAARQAFNSYILEGPACLRADNQINQTIRKVAEAKPEYLFFNLEKEVILASPKQIPGYEIFHDYCHYNRAGHVLVGHMLAEKVASIVNLSINIPTPITAMHREWVLRKGRLEDLPEIEHWAGVDHDVTLLMTHRKNDSIQSVNQAMARVQNGQGTALDYLYAGNWKGFNAVFDNELDGAIGIEFYNKALQENPGLKEAESNKKLLLKNNIY